MPDLFPGSESGPGFRAEVLEHADRADRYRKQSAELIDAALAELGEPPRDERRGRRR